MPEQAAAAVHLQSMQGFGGPRGTACYVGSTPGDHSRQISLVIFPRNHYLAPYALSTQWWEGGESDESVRKGKILQVENGTFLEKVPFTWKGTLSNGRKVNLLSKGRFHPYNTYCIGHSWRCRHIEHDQGCRYCTLSLSVDKLNLPDLMAQEDNFLYLQLARLYNPIRSVTLTSGTIESPEKTARILLPLVRRIREDTGLTVHVQIEPIFDRLLMKELSEVADSIGIFMEFFDERVRQRICPGKAGAFSQDAYLRSWEMAVSFFGRGKVVTTNILGFDEDYEIILKGIERAAAMGVTTSVAWLRSGSPKLGNIIPSYLGRDDELLQLHMEVGKILVKYSVDTVSLKHSGCLGCCGCSATREAILWARETLKEAEYQSPGRKPAISQIAGYQTYM